MGDLRTEAKSCRLTRRTLNGQPTKKTYLHLGDRPILSHTLQVFDQVHSVNQILVVAGKDDIERCQSEAIAPYNFETPIQLVAGGSTRQESVFCGLQIVPEDTDWIAVHDGVRPFVTTSQIERCLAAAYNFQAATLAVPVKDTIKVANQDLLAVETPDRQNLWAVQTPQVFSKDLLLDAHVLAQRRGISATDDAALVEQFGAPVKLVEGDYRNLKITTPEDLEIAHTFLMGSTQQAQVRTRLISRTGIGYDLHRLVPNRKLILGGVEIPFELGLLGHSDADVLTHAICDAMLGAAALGDIGQHFPDTDPRYAGIDSLILLDRVNRLVYSNGDNYNLCVQNIDATVICQRPKLAAYIPLMKQKLAQTLKVDSTRINIKATTAEGLGFIGQSLAIAVQAVCNLSSENDSHQ